MTQLITVAVAASVFGGTPDQTDQKEPTPRVIQVEWSTDSVRQKSLGRRVIKVAEPPPHDPLVLWILPDGREVISHAKPAELREPVEEKPG